MHDKDLQEDRRLREGHQGRASVGGEFSMSALGQAKSLFVFRDKFRNIFSGETSIYCHNPKVKIVLCGWFSALIVIGSANAAKGMQEECRSILFATTLKATEMPTTEIVVRLRPDVARAFQDKSAVANSAATRDAIRDMEAVLARFGAKMRPQHPGVSDPGLAAYFTVQGVSPSRAEELAAALRQLKTVEAAYVKPPAEPARPPSGS
jgi:hypothetical protein